MIFDDTTDLIAEAGRLWELDQDDGTVQLLQNRCGIVGWQNPGSNFSSTGYRGRPALFEDALWWVSGIGEAHVDRLPICRECGTCCGLVGKPIHIKRRQYPGG
jgi:hypothetical protein